jgi:hypothetical protein
MEHDSSSPMIAHGEAGRRSLARAILTERLKSILRPVARHRTLLERAKFIGVPILEPQAGNDLLGQWLQESKPRAIGKMGESELGALRRYAAHRDERGICRRWGGSRRRLTVNAGVYPPDDASLSRFCAHYGGVLAELDMLAVWFHWGERRTVARRAPAATLAALTALEPFYHQRPWSRHLAGKRVLVISPFAQTIKRQYAQRERIWQNKPEVLPDFRLETLRCPLSAALVEPPFGSWFDAMLAMQAEMDCRVYDVAIVGAGAWSLPLASHAKSRGKWAIHLGGGTQILFGIRGRRWDGNAFLRTIYNDAWVRPDPADRPPASTLIENSCYW